ncbi:clavesin-2-like [Haematobia irritans]|uniref:clavesin-2-like n=1 Tax=Haematobia irritans TaxID=7368 RepID=UPI003F50390D
MANIKPLPEELQKIAIEQLNELPSRIHQDLNDLKTWIGKQPHLRARMEDQFLIQFLRGCKYSLERAKEKIDLYFTLKTKYPDMFGLTDLNDPQFSKFFKLGCFNFLPQPLHGNGARIVAIQFNYNTEVHTRVIYIFDMRKTNLGHLLQLTPNFCKKSVSYLEKSMPLRIQGVYFVYAPAYAQQFFKLLLPLFSEKLRKRVHIMGSDLEQLTKHIPLTYLPRDMGGENGLCREITAEYYKILQANCEYFSQNSQYGTDESLRPGNPLELDGLFGVGGSFRQLTVD